MLSAGDFIWGEATSNGRRALYIVLPGDKNPTAIHVRHDSDRGVEREWAWDGNEDKPTLTPSILVNGQWHGYLTAGRLVSC